MCAGSPPCQAFSSCNPKTGPDLEEDRQAGKGLIKWFLDTALGCGATSWSMEEVDNPVIRNLLDPYKKDHSEKVDYDVFHLNELGVPQTRKRIIAGSPHLIDRLRSLCNRLKYSAKDAIATPRGTHIKTTQNTEKTPDGNRPLPLGKGTRCWETGLAPTIVAGDANRWLTIKDGKAVRDSLKDFNPTESAALQTFPKTYMWPPQKTEATKQIGNAVPPLIAALMLSDEHETPEDVAARLDFCI